MSPATSSKPTILFIHGAWHTPEHYSPIISRLHNNGYTVEAPRLKTVNNAIPANKTVDDDILQVRGLAESILSQGHDIVGVFHSYGGVVGSYALAGLSEESKKDGRGIVKALVYICSFPPPEGQNILQLLGSAPWLTLNDETQNLDINQPPKVLFYDPDVSDEQAGPAVEALCYHPIAAQNVAPKTPLPGGKVAWRDIPATYLFCTLDQALPFMFQKKFIEDNEKGQEGLKFEKVVLEAGHSPFLSMPDRVIEEIVKVAGSY